MSAMMEAALAYAARALPVFPLAPGAKTPLVKGGFKSATTDPQRIRRWWTETPSANIGVPTGAASGWLVLDIDVKKDAGGEESLRKLLNGHDALPATLEARTPSGGRHMIFRTPLDREIRNSAGKLGLGLDVRGEGGYIAVAPSVVNGVAYSWTAECEPATAPDWLLDRASGSKIPEGERNASITSIAGSLRAKGLLGAELERALLEANAARCDPPLHESEVIGIAQGIQRYPVKRPLTDLGNAERLADAAHERLKFCSQLGAWFFWDGNRWRQDEDGAVHRAMRSVVRSMYTQAHAENDDDRRRALAKWATTSESAGKLNAAVELAKSDERLIVDVIELDADPWLLGVRNGVLNLRTGQLLPADPQRLITKQALVAFDPEARAPLWEKVLTRIFAEDGELIAYLRRAVGYILSGDTMLKTMFFLYGPGGDNGKSTLCETLMALLGDYAVKTRAETFMAAKNTNASAASPERMALRGARLVVASELSDRQRFDEVFVKDATGGVDRIAGRKLYQEPISFKPEFKMVLYGNHKPKLRSDDPAVWRRLNMVPFEVRIPPEEQDIELPHKLIAELPGILNWALAGLRDLRERGMRLAPPKKVLEAGQQYRDDMDDFGGFLNERCVVQSGLKAKGGELYSEFKKWADENGIEHPLTNNTFSQCLVERGFKKHISEGRSVWDGIGLAAVAEQGAAGGVSRPDEAGF